MDLPERYAWLAPLLPVRPADADTCATCAGTGSLAHPDLVCVCGGAGWMPHVSLVGADALHDATLEAVAVDWRAGTAEARFRTADGPVVVRAAGLARLSCPRLQPWGPSASVNALREVEVTSAGRRAIELEMQSGDVIEIEAAGFARIRS